MLSSRLLPATAARCVRYCSAAASAAGVGTESTTATDISSPSHASGARRPDLDFDYILDPANADAIRRNAEQRKHACSVDAVHRAWSAIQSALRSGPSNVDAVQLKQHWDRLYDEAGRLPNATHAAAPLDQNVVLDEFGPEFDSRRTERVRTMEELCRRSRTLRTDVTFACGDRAYVLLAPVARLEQALLDYAVDFVTANDTRFQLISVPDLLPADVVEGCGLGERAATGLSYHVGRSPGTVLSGTGEAGVAHFLTGKVFDEDQLPLKFLTLSRCYRPEAHGGADEQWLYRVHEFNKVEMFVVSANPADENRSNGVRPSEEALQQLISLQRSLYTSVGLRCRLVDMCAEELGAAAARKFDVEAWMPGRKMWGEVSSASNCTDYQSRRLHIYYRCKSTGQLRPVHTCNATAAAGGRLLIALVETFQTQRGPISVPLPLRAYLNEERGPSFAECQLKMAVKEMRTVF